MVEQAQAQPNGAVPDGRDAPGAEVVDGGEDLAGLRRALDEERKQRRAFERQVKELQTAREQVEAAKRGDVERLTADLAKITAERDQLSQAASARLVRDAVTDYAEKAGARRAATVARLVIDDVTLGEDGLPTSDSVTRALADLKKSDPDLFRAAGSVDGAARGAGVGAANDMNALLRRAAGRG